MKNLQKLALALGCVLALGSSVALKNVEAGYHHGESHCVRSAVCSPKGGV